MVLASKGHKGLYLLLRVTVRVPHRLFHFLIKNQLPGLRKGISHFQDNNATNLGGLFEKSLTKTINICMLSKILHKSVQNVRHLCFVNDVINLQKSQIKISIIFV